MNLLLDSLRHQRVGILFGLLTLCFGFGLGGVFGLAEDRLKGHLKAEADAVMESVYVGDEQAAAKVTSKSWAYFKRAHLHANGLGTSALVLITFLALARAPNLAKRFIALALGVGALGYSLFWLLAGCRAPGLGSTGAAKASLEWLAMPTAGLCLVGLVAVTVLVLRTLFVAKTS